MKSLFFSRGLAGLFTVAALLLSGCGYNDFQRLDEQPKSAWSEVLNQYQRRADLVPNIVATVKGEANFEQETLTKVGEDEIELMHFAFRYLKYLLGIEKGFDVKAEPGS